MHFFNLHTIGPLKRLRETWQVGFDLVNYFPSAIVVSAGRSGQMITIVLILRSKSWELIGINSSVGIVKCLMSFSGICGQLKALKKVFYSVASYPSKIFIFSTRSIEVGQADTSKEVCPLCPEVIRFCGITSTGHARGSSLCPAFIFKLLCISRLSRKLAWRRVSPSSRDGMLFL